jgi:hypothetical protein
MLAAKVKWGMVMRRYNTERGRCASAVSGALVAFLGPVTAFAQ